MAIAPNRNAHQVLEEVQRNCWKNDWVIDLDIKGFFDNIDHAKLMLAVRKHVPENWACMYIERWLQMPIQRRNGELIQKQGKGTPQGGVISPLLANLFLHYAFDKWIENLNSNVKFERYADDAIIHCRTKRQADWLLKPNCTKGWQNVILNCIPKRLNWFIVEITAGKRNIRMSSSIF